MITPERMKKSAGKIGIAVLVTCLVVSIAPVAALAQSSSQNTRKDYALIFGTVWSSQDRPVYGVRVKIRRADDKKAHWELMSDHNGEFAQRVPPGKAEYIVWADIKMPKGKPQPQTTVRVENDERVDIGLHLTE